MIHEKKNGNVKLYICLAAALCAYLPTGVNMYAARAEKPSASNVYQQTRILVSGRILDSSGQPVPGASVIEKGTTNGVNTDIDGKFTISVKSGSSLEVSCIGYETVSVAASENLSVTLREDTQFLDEVVVVGFGTQKKVNMTGSVAAVDVDKAFGSKPITDVSKGLQGVVPGLSITYNSNDLNASPTMKIRGTGSINGDNTPLILLDGVEVPDLSFVNPDNIKSISVLKDAASASIYGSRAAWGVVLITSKDGSAVKDKVSITYSNNFSWNQPIGLPKYITDKEGVLAQLEEGMLAQKNVDGSRIEAFGMYYDTIGKGITTWFDKYSGNLSNPVYKYGEDYEFIEGTPYYYRVSDPNKEIFKTSFSQTHNLSVTGNTGKTNYNIGLGYTMNDGTLKAAKKNDVKRYNLNLSTNTQVKNWLNIGTKVMYVEKEYEYPYGYSQSKGATGLLYYVMRFPAFFPFGISDGSKLADGTYASESAATGEGLYFRHGNAYVANESICSSKDQYLTLGGNVRINLAPGLSFYGDYTRGRYNYENRSMRQPYYVANWSFPKKAAFTTKDFLERTYVSKITNTYNAYFDYLFDIQKQHNFAIKVGANAEDLRYDSQSVEVNGVQDLEHPTLNLTDGKNEGIVDESLRHRATAGFFGRINYNYKEKYLLELNGRYDGSSSFRTGKQWAFFSSASAGYRISEEKFWTNIKPYVPTLKVRASYGSVGNQALASWYPYISTMATETVGWVGTDMNNVSTTTTPSAVNPDMTWEKIRTLDIGFDAGFFNNELNVTFDWYQRRNVGMLVAGNEIVRYAGIAVAPLENGGDMKTNGWELQIDYNHAFNKDFAIYGTFTLSDAKSEITKWNNTTGALNSWYKGKKLGEIWGFETDRYFNSSDVNQDGTLKTGTPDQSYLQNGSFRFGAGDIKYKDLNNDGKIDTGKGTIDDHGDLKRIGNQLPRYEYSLRVGAMLKGFDVEVLLQGVGKRDMWSTSSLFIPHAAGAQMNIFENQLDYWTESNQNARFPRPYINGAFGSLSGLPGNSGCNNFAPQTKYLNNLAYLRVKNFTVGYTLPQNLTRKIFVEKLRFYFSAQNLFTFDHIDGVMDPECTGGSSKSYTNGMDMTMAGRAMPFNRQWSCGLQITF
ncbi:susC/RagA family TonB-linked outer membrane protein [Bacteroides sp. CAG:770]|nr:susC/RagA family TonB-linked outer membrane protein [Bacteroides sp. CAG:770]